MGSLHKIDIGLDPKNNARLAMKEYSKEYTNVPNTSLPQNLFNDLNVIYQYLYDTELPLNDYTFLIKARDGKFSKVYSPAIYVSRLDKNLVIKWGSEFIPILIDNGELKLKNGKKCKLVFKQEKVNGYDNPVLTSSFSVGKEMYSMSFPIRRVSLEDNIEADELEMYLESNDVNTLMEQIQEPPESSNDDNKDSYVGTGDKLVGDIIKTSYLPLGTYDVTAVRRYKNTYGIQHLIQTEIPDDNKFVATVSSQDDEGNWVQEEKEISGKVILKANSKLNKLLLSDIIVSEEKPAKLTILEKGTYNGYPTVKLDLQCEEYTLDKELFDISF